MRTIAMRRLGLGLLAGLCGLFATVPAGHTQIVIPDLNRDTIKSVPLPPGAVGKIGTDATGQSHGMSATVQSRKERDLLCKKLPENMRRTTPGCQP